MISVIIPIYNNETTLRRCVDSVIAQTERDLEIILVDDGSTDDSGMIADSYRSDPRIRAFHKENGGLSSTRNYGLGRANGEYIAFADADDWIEPNTYETALRAGGDVCVFGYAREYVGKTELRKPIDVPETIDSGEAIKRLIADISVEHCVWSKLYRRELFDGIRFPEGVIYEDIRTTYKILSKAARITVIPDVLYHYVQYEGSLVHDSAAKNRLDHWTATYELYRVFGEKDEVYRGACVRKCAYSIYRAWGSLWTTGRETRLQEADRIREIILFARKYRRCIVFDKKCGAHVKTVFLFAGAGSRWSQFCAHLLSSIIRLLKPSHLYRRSDCVIPEGKENGAEEPAESGI